jgi:ribonuclease III
MSLEAKLGHRFADPSLLRMALTHRSVSAEDPTRVDNERLEFLGDAVLQLVVTDLLYAGHPDLPEGELAKVRAAVVSRPMLAEVAGTLGLGRYIELAAGEERTGGREKGSILGDALEAVLGAVYLDGGFEAVAGVVAPLWEPLIADRAERPGVRDYKTRLQEILAKDGERPRYEIESSGPDHDRRFVATVIVDGTPAGTGSGRSKKAAEQEAAREAIAAISHS